MEVVVARRNTRGICMEKLKDGLVYHFAAVDLLSIMHYLFALMQQHIWGIFADNIVIISIIFVIES